MLRYVGDPLHAIHHPPAAGPQRWQKRVDQILAGHTWSFSRTVQVANVSVRVRSDEPTTGKLLSLLLSALPSHPDGGQPAAHSIAVVSLPLSAGLPAEPRAGRSRYRVVADGRVVGRRDRPEDAVALALHHVDEVAIEATDLLAFHAGAVERNGSVVMVFGDSGSGKSTLTGALLRHSFAYLTDEVGLVDPNTFEVLPYPKALDLHPNSIELLEIDGADAALGAVKHKVLPHRLGSVSSSGRLELMVFLDPTPSWSNPVGGRTLAPADTLMRLLPVTFGSTLATRSHLQAMAYMCERTSAVGLGRGTLNDAVDAIERSLQVP